MKWQRFVSGMRLSKLFKGLIALALIKLTLLAVVGWNTLALDRQSALRRTPVVAELASPAAAVAQGTQNNAQPAPPTGMANAPSGPQADAKDPLRPKVVSKPSRDAGDITSAALARRAEELDRRERELDTLEAKITKDMAELDKRRAQLQRLIEEANTVRDQKDRHLVDVFANMKARQAAQVLQTMDERQAVKILSGMRGRQAGEILTYVDAQKAARLAEALTKLHVPFE